MSADEIAALFQKYAEQNDPKFQEYEDLNRQLEQTLNQIREQLTPNLEQFLAYVEENQEDQAIEKWQDMAPHERESLTSIKELMEKYDRLLPQYQELSEQGYRLPGETFSPAIEELQEQVTPIEVPLQLRPEFS